MSLLTSGVVGALFMHNGTIAVESMNRRLLQSVVILKENAIDLLIEEYKGEIEEMSKIGVVSGFASGMSGHQEASDVLDEKLEHAGFTEIFIINSQGEVMFSTDSEQEGKIKSDDVYFVNGKEGIYVTGFFFDISTQEPSMVVSAPVEGSSGSVIAARVDLTEISEIMSEQAGLGETGETYLVNVHSLMVSESRFIEGLEFRQTVHTEGVDDCISGNSGHMHYEDYRGVEVAGTYSWLPERKVCLVAEIEESEVYGWVFNFYWMMLISIVLVVAIMALVGLGLSRSITSPIIMLRDVTSRAMKERKPEKVKVKSRDEVGELARTFNNMLDDIRNYKSEIGKHERELEKEVKQRTLELEKSKKKLEEKVEEMEKLNRMSTGRELRMIELKKRIRELEKEAGK